MGDESVLGNPNGKVIPADPSGGVVKELSQREVEVIALIAGGLTAVEVGVKLGISAQTVTGHGRRIREKLGARNIASAVAIAMATGKISLVVSKNGGGQ